MRMVRIVGLASVALAGAFGLASSASAQSVRMSGMMGTARPMGSPIVFHAPRSTGVMRPGPLRTTPTSATTNVRTSVAPVRAPAGTIVINGTPDPYINSGGAPFYVDGVLNAGPGSPIIGTNSQLGVKAFIDPVTQLELSTFERLRGNGSYSGLYIPLLPAYAAVPTDEDESSEAYPPDQSQGAPPSAQPQQPQVIILQEAPQAAAASTEPAQAPQAEEQQPIRDEGEFLLIFNDGHSENAAAFTRSGDQVVYVTQDGMRQTVPVSEIDLQATQRVNQERGTPLQLD
ncbi:MAG TPA: hypothetical protein VMU43_14040 [Candidatus Acidoferrum sp.]|nr:hypothetical protein [Candidatus Acidoferrum sp.]